MVFKICNVDSSAISEYSLGHLILSDLRVPSISSTGILSDESF